MTLAEVVKAVRQRGGMRTLYVAGIAGLSRRSISRVERGERPDSETCGKLANALKLDPDLVMLLAGYVPERVSAALAAMPDQRSLLDAVARMEGALGITAR